LEEREEKRKCVGDVSSLATGPRIAETREKR